MATKNSIVTNHTLPGYQILDQVGQGGMSTVYRARHDTLNRTVAIKFLTGELSRNIEDRQAFKFETQAAARINHPNVVQLFDAGEVSNRPYYVMEYVSGANLGELISMRGKMEEEDALLIAEKIAVALRHCWLEHRLIHCDVKPENIITDMHGTVKLTDLGLARIDGLALDNSDTDLTIGTPAYMSPEQAMGTEDLDVRTDIYALGALLYHMVTGYRLFEGESDAETAQSQVSYAVEDVIDVNPSASPAFAWMLERMLLKDRDQRYASWEEVLTDIHCVKTKNMIKGGVFDPDLSTMTRSKHRSIPPASKGPAPDFNKAAPLVATTSVTSTATDPRKIKVSRDKIAQVGQQSTYRLGKGFQTRKEYDVNKAFLSMLLVAGIAVVLYALTYGKLQLDLSKTPSGATPAAAAQIQNERPATQTPLRVAENQNNAVEEADDEDWFAEDKPAPAQPVAAAKEENRPVAPAKTVEEANAFFDEITGTTPNSNPAQEKAAAPFADDLNESEESPPRTQAALTWNNPNFIKAVNALERSQTRYEDYLKNRGEKRVLDSIEKNCQAAIKVFNDLEGKAPAGVDLDSYSKKAYTLLANCQWTKQLL